MIYLPLEGKSEGGSGGVSGDNLLMRLGRLTRREA